MKRPHPYLAVSLVCAAVVLATLALACPGAAQAWLPIPPRTPTPTPAPSSEAQCLPYIHGFVVYPGSPECTSDRYSDVLNVPTDEWVAGIRYFTIRIIQTDLQSGALTTSLTAAGWNGVLNEAGDLIPVFLDRPLYGKYAATPHALPANCGTSWCGCASGLGTWPPKVDVSQRKGRVEQLIAWKFTNAILGKLNRSDLWDNAYVSSVVTRVGQQLGGWSQ